MLLLQNKLEKVTDGFAKERQQFGSRIAAGEKANRSLEVLCVCVCVSMPSLNAYIYVYIYIYT